MSKSQDLIKNTMIIGLGRVSTQLISFLLLPLYTFFLSPADYGLVDLIMMYILLLAPSLTLQLEMAVFRFLVDARSSDDYQKKVISNILYLMTPLIVVIIALALIGGWLSNFQYTAVTLLAGLAIIFMNMSLQIARGMGNNKQFAIASVVVGLTTLFTSVGFITYAGMRIEGVLLSVAVANLMGATYLFLKLRLFRYIGSGMEDRALQREILGYSTPLVPNGAAWWVINASDRTIITLMISSAANGIYAVASKYSAIFTTLFGIFNMSWTESASMHINAKDRDKFFSDVSNAALRIFGVLGLGLIATIPFIFSWFVDESFHEAYRYIPLLVVAALFNAIVGLYSAIYVAKKLTKQVMNTSLVAAAINIGLTIGFVPLFGLYAAASATAIAFLTMAIFRHYDVKKYVTISYEKRLFFILPCLYGVVISLYYFDNIIASSIGLSLAVVAAVILNRNAIRVIKNSVLKRNKA